MSGTRCCTARITRYLRSGGGSSTNVNYSVANSPAFAVQPNEKYHLKFNLAFLNTASAYPRFQIINATDIQSKVGWKQAWSNSASPNQEGTISLYFSVDENATATGNNGMFQVWNREYANWTITDVSLDKVTSGAPILIKAGLDRGNYQSILLPSEAPPVATDNDEKIMAAITEPIQRSRFMDRGLWNLTATYVVGDYVYQMKDNIKYYYVSKTGTEAEPQKGNPPPNSSYWIADQCSKSLTGCRMRWGIQAINSGGARKDKKNQCIIGGAASGNKGGLPYGGFPAATKIQKTFTSR